MDESAAPLLATLPIVLAPAPVLKARARPVLATDDARALAEKMLATMYAAPGIGLAAPQVDMPLRLAVIDLQRDEAAPLGRQPLVLVNPEIVRTGAALVTLEEGCLSLPGHYADVERPEAVRVRYQDLAGTRHELDTDGLLARCVQHEIDHLDGILFVDRISALKRNMILRKIAKERKSG
jgi:peptide deformylase